MSVTINTPASGATLTGTTSVTATFVGARFDIATVTIDGQQLASDASLPLAFAVDTKRVADGPHTLTVAVRAGAPKRWQKASISVVVKNAVAPPAQPSVPTGLTATPADGKVTLTWNANPAAEAVDVYQVYEADEPLNLSVPGLSLQATKDHAGAPLVNGRTYSFRVSAHNAKGYGDWSAAVSAAPSGPPPPPPPLPANVAVSAPTASVT